MNLKLERHWIFCIDSWMGSAQTDSTAVFNFHKHPSSGSELIYTESWIRKLKWGLKRRKMKARKRKWKKRKKKRKQNKIQMKVRKNTTKIEWMRRRTEMRNKLWRSGPSILLCNCKWRLSAQYYFFFSCFGFFLFENIRASCATFLLLILLLFHLLLKQTRVKTHVHNEGMYWIQLN